MSFHYPTVNYQILLHFRLKRGEPPLKPKLIPTQFSILLNSRLPIRMKTNESSNPNHSDLGLRWIENLELNWKFQVKSDCFPVGFLQA